MSHVWTTGITPGEYPAEISEIDEDESKYGPVLWIEFKLKGGNVDGETIRTPYSLRSDGRITPMSKIGSLIRRLLGEPQAGKTIIFQDLIGKECSVQVEERKAENGGTFPRVVDVFAVSQNVVSGNGEDVKSPF